MYAGERRGVSAVRAINKRQVPKREAREEAPAAQGEQEPAVSILSCFFLCGWGNQS